MSRSTLSPAARAETGKNSVRVAELAEFAFPGGTIRITTAERDIYWNGVVWSANALLQDFSGVSESSDLKARRISIQLSALDSTLLNRIFTDKYHYARVQLYLVFLDESWQLIAEPYAFGDELLLSNCAVSLDTEAGSVELSAETWDIFNQRDSAALATPESQRMRYPGDSGLDRVAAILTQDIEWGGRSVRIGEISGPGTGIPGGPFLGGPIGGRLPPIGGLDGGLPLPENVA